MVWRRFEWVGAIAPLMLACPSLAESAATFRQQGLQYRSQGQYPEAIAAFEKAVNLEPGNFSGRVLLGWTQHRAGQSEIATDTLTQAFYQNPFEASTLNALGIVHLVRGQLKAAIASHTWAAFLKPDNEIAYYNLSLAFEQLGQYDWAIAMAQKAAQLEPSNPHPLIAQAIAHWGNGEISQARQQFQQAEQLNPSFAALDYLIEDLTQAGFAPTQIKVSQQIQQATQ